MAQAFCKRLAIFASFAAFSALAFAEADTTGPLAQVMAMVKAMHSLNYQGTVVLYKNGELDTVRFTHLSTIQGQTQEHVLALNSPLWEVVRDSQKVMCIYPEAQAVIIDHLPLHRSFLIDFPDAPDSLQSHYDYLPDGEEMVALQAAQIIAIKPKDNYRYARKLWVSKDSQLPLKYAMLDGQGKVLEQVAFTDLKVDPQLAQSFTDIDKYANPHLSTQHIHQLQPLPFEQSSFILLNVPPGFEKSFYTRRKMHGQEELVEHLILKDGLASVSVYVEKQDGAMADGIKAAGAINSYTRRMGAFQITTMGDVPADTVRFIAEGVQFRKPVE